MVYIDPVSKATIGHWAYFQQVMDLAFKVLKSCTPRKPSAHFHNLVEQSGDSSIDFFTRVTMAVKMSQLGTY